MLWITEDVLTEMTPFPLLYCLIIIEQAIPSVELASIFVLWYIPFLHWEIPILMKGIPILVSSS
jgi:hypothetical protein